MAKVCTFLGLQGATTMLASTTLYKNHHKTAPVQQPVSDFNTAVDTTMTSLNMLYCELVDIEY